MMTITLNNNVVLYEGVISNEQNEQFLRELNKSLKSFSAEITGGSFYEGKLWLGVKATKNGEPYISRRIMDTFGIDDLVLNGTSYSYGEVLQTTCSGSFERQNR